MKRIILLSVYWLLFLFFFCLPSQALEGGRVIGAEKVYLRGGVSYISSGGTNSSSLPIRIGYGFTTNFEGTAAIAIMNVAGISATGFQLGIEYQALNDKTNGLNLAFSVPFTIYSISGVSVNQSGVLFDISKDYEGFSPYLTLGAGITSSGSTSVTSYPISIGIITYPANNFDVYGSVGTSMSSSGSNPLNLSVGVEIKL